MPQPKTVLFVSIDGMTDPLGQSQVLPYLTGLAAKGYSIEIISCEKENNFNSTRQVIESIAAQHHIRWNYCSYKSSLPLLSQLQNYFRLKQLTRKRLLVHDKQVLLHCRSYLPAIIGLRMKNAYATPYIFDMRGFWADERVDGNIWSRTNPITNFLYKKFKRREKQLLQQADMVISLTHKAKDIILSWNLGLQPGSIRVIPCCADLQHFSVAGLDGALLQKLRSGLPQLHDKFVLSYIGSLGTWYMIDEMMGFYRELLKKTDAVFLIITKDDPAIALEAAAKAGISPDQVIVRPAFRAEVPCYIHLSQLSVFFIRPSFSKQASSPTKMGELLSMGVPIVTNTGVGDVDSIIRSESCGILVEGFSEAGYAKAIAEAMKNAEHYRQHAIPTAFKYFSLEEGVKKYHEVYAAFLGDGSLH